MMNVLIYSFNLAFIFFLAYRWWRADHSPFRKIYWPSLLLKLGAGLLLGYVYSHQYSDSDTVNFFQSSIELSDLARKDVEVYLNYLRSETDAPYSGENRTLFFVKLVSLFSLFTNNNYWITSLYFSLLSFFTFWWLARKVSNSFPDFTWPVVFAFLVFPSSVFWSSGVIKETAALVSVCFLSGLYIKIWRKNKIPVWQILLSGLAVWVLWSLKYYYAALLLPVMSAALLTRWFAEHRMKQAVRSAYRELVLFVVLLMVMFFVTTFIHPNLYPQRIVDVIVENNRLFMESSQPDKVIHFYNLEPTFGSLVINMPWALVSGLFRPFIWEAGNIFQILVSIENIFLGFLVFVGLKNIKILNQSSYRILLMSIMVYCTLLCVFLALSAPNFGTLVRYRIGFLPFFVALVSYQSSVVRILEKLFKSRPSSL